MWLVFIIALIGSLALTPLVRIVAWRFGAVSWPDGGRHRHAKPTALWGGIAVYLGAMLGVAASYQAIPGTYNMMMLLTAFGASTGVLCLLGCYDDRFGMKAIWKLVGQALCTLPVVLVGCSVDRVVVFGYGFDLGWAGTAITIFWLVLGINAMNLLDGMDGLASIVGIVISLAVVVISFQSGNPEGMLLAVAIVGALLGFLPMNLPPARIYLGDCGSMIIGLAVAVLSLQVTVVDQMTASPVLAITLLFIPLTDTTLTIVRRFLKGQGLLVADRGHIHHRLLDQGISIPKILLLLGGLSALTATLAWMVAIWNLELLACLAMATIMAVLVRVRLIGHWEWALVRWVSSRSLRTIRRQPIPRLVATAKLSNHPQLILAAETSDGPTARQTGGAAAEPKRKAA